jgi:uncharacterized damage-inducible protein DinB
MTNKEFFIKTWNSEKASTLSALNGLPDDMSKLSYKCDDKARTAEAIIGHIVGHVEVMCESIDSNIANEKSDYPKFSSKAEAASFFEKYADMLVEKLNAVDEKKWEEQIIDFQFDGNSLFAYPMSNTFWMFMFDIIHHRGQLSTYYRSMGVRNPQIYGPAAEDMEEMHS